MRRVVAWTVTCGVAWLCSTVFAAIEDLSIGVAQVTLNDPTFTVTGTPPEVYDVTFPVGAFSTAPAVFILPDNANGDPMTLRVYNVTASGFTVFVSESDGEDNTVYPDVDFDYLAIEPGNYTIGGANIQVGTTTVTSVSSKAAGTNHQNVSYLSNYTGTAPVVITELQSLNSDPTLINGMGEFVRTTQPFLELSQGTPTLTNFPVSLERAETTAGSVSGETVAWMAITDTTDISANDDDANGIDIKAFYSADNITGNCVATTLVSGGVTNFAGGSPIYFGSQVKRDGGDGGWARRCSSNTSSVTVQIEEDLVDGEQGHTTEQVNFLAVSEAFQMSTGDVDSPSINMVVASDTVPASSGGVTVTYMLNPTTVTFSDPSIFGIDFTAAPVVVPMSTDEGNGDPAFVRVWGISSSGFTMAQTIPEGTTAAASSMTVDFMAVVPGVHILPDGTEIAAGVTSVGDCVGSASGCPGTSDPLISYGTTFANTPAVLAAAQVDINTGNNPANNADPLLATSITSVGASNFRAAFEYAQTSLGAPISGPEDMGWIAMEGGVSTGLHAAEGTTSSGDHLIEIRTQITTNNIGGWDDNCQSNNFPTAFTLTSDPLTIATHNSRNGGDGGWLRRCANSANSFGLQVDEDTAADGERSHGSREVAGVIAFSETFGWTPGTYSNMKLGVTFRDPVNLLDNPKAIPLAEVDYTVEIEATSRIGIDEDAVTITDNIPPETILFVGDLSGGCPVAFDPNGNGGDNSNLTFDCNADLLLFTAAKPGGCTPDADGYCPFSTYAFGGDWSADVTSIKLEPKGEFAGSDGTSEPKFSFRYRVQIQ